MAVFGVPLDQDEQVFYAYEMNMKSKKKTGMLIGIGLMVLGFVSMWFMCITFIAIPIGGFVLYKAMNPDGNAIVAMALTSKRMLAVPFDKGAEHTEVAIADIEDVECKRKGKKVTHKRGLAAMAVNAAANAVKEHQQNKQAKTHPNYWTNAVELHLFLSGGRQTKWNIDESEGPNVGPILATGLVRGWDSLVPIEGYAAERSVSLL